MLNLNNHRLFKINNTIIIKNKYLIVDKLNLPNEILDIIVKYLNRNNIFEYYNKYVLSQILLINNNLYTMISTNTNGILCNKCINYNELPFTLRILLTTSFFTNPLCYDCIIKRNKSICIYYIPIKERYIIKHKYLYNNVLKQLKI